MRDAILGAGLCRGAQAAGAHAARIQLPVRGFQAPAEVAGHRHPQGLPAAPTSTSAILPSPRSHTGRDSDRMGTERTLYSRCRRWTPQEHGGALVAGKATTGSWLSSGPACPT